jgi:hypothetical protein
MKTLGALLFAAAVGFIGAPLSYAQAPRAVGKIAPRPLYRDPPFDAPTDPVFCYNAEQKKWLMYYTARRAAAENAPGVTWIHGTNIGMAESSDGGATWTYRGTADIRYGKDAHPNDFKYWAPEVIWHEGDPKPGNETSGSLSPAAGCGPLNASIRRSTDAEKRS